METNILLKKTGRFWMQVIEDCAAAWKNMYFFVGFVQRPTFSDGCLQPVGGSLNREICN